ncbi:MAG: lysylphosphatidylglycerol synthase domain-containing protein [Mycoplasmataceae bacterium]|nr:lysylphosphatidylglycerol synthase domain-containing protein [Mycoplasmataceae bacterium]
MTMFVLIPFTPANFITSPYTIWWLKKRGFTTPEAAAQTLVDTLLWQLIQMIISLSSFITITYHIVYTKDIEFTSQVEVGYWFIVGGIVMDWVILVFLFVVGFSVHIHLWISLLSNKIKKIMHLSYSTSAETRKKYLEDKVIKNKFKELLFKDWKITLFVIGAYACWEICTYSLLAGGLELVKADESISISFIKVFDVSNVSNTATKFMPVPGEEGLIQWMMSSLFSSGYGISGINDHREIKEFTKNGITIWRFFTTYIPLFIGLSYFLIFYICKAIKKYIIK